jgi:hypothetical protein
LISRLRADEHLLDPHEDYFRLPVNLLRRRSWLATSKMATRIGTKTGAVRLNQFIGCSSSSNRSRLDGGRPWSAPLLRQPEPGVVGQILPELLKPPADGRDRFAHLGGDLGQPVALKPTGDEFHVVVCQA